jgi:hypothetical protein
LHILAAGTEYLVGRTRYYSMLIFFFLKNFAIASIILRPHHMFVTQLTRDVRLRFLLLGSLVRIVMSWRRARKRSFIPKSPIYL